MFEHLVLRLTVTSYNLKPKDHAWLNSNKEKLAIIPRARMGSESIANEGEGRIAVDSEAMMRARGIIVFISKIQLVGQKYRE